MDLPANTEITLIENRGVYTATFVTIENAVKMSNDQNSIKFKLTDDGTIKVINHLDAVSPTGLDIRYGPYLLLLLTGAVLLVVGRWRRRERGTEGRRLKEHE